MILSFTIENFRSFKERSVLTFEASGNKSHNASHIFTSPSGQQVLKSAGLYGANASGKSNFLLAFDALKYLVVKTGSLTEGKKIACYEPYRLCEDTKHAPIKFELEFLNRDNVKFIYKISYLANKILSESLDFYPSRAKANIFTREEGQTWEDIKFGSLYKGGLERYLSSTITLIFQKLGTTQQALNLCVVSLNFSMNRYVIFQLSINLFCHLKMMTHKKYYLAQLVY